MLSKYKFLKGYLKINKYFAKYSTEQIITCLQKVSWIFLILLLLVIAVNIVCGNIDKILPLVAAVGILISALLASYTMLLNINKNIELKNRDIELKNREHSNLVRDIFFKLCLIKMRLITLKNERKREKVTYIDIDRIFDTVEDIGNLLQDIKTLDIVTIVHNSVLSDIHFIYLEVLTLQTNLRATRKNLVRPDLSKNNPEIFPNPLKMDMRLEIAIQRLSSTLTYLKNGYKKDFPNDSGIQECAEYEKQINKVENE